jgi:cardiolipin synthase
VWRRRAKLTLPAPFREGARDLEYALKPGTLTPANRITPLRAGGETFPAMLEAIAAAREYVHFETYIYRSDTTGRRFGAALIERAKAGVVVKLMMDGLGSRGINPGFLAELRAAGVEVVQYRPLLVWRAALERLAKRDHRKILVVDGKVGFTGGLNIGDEYAPAHEGGGGWLDLHCRVEGPAVGDLARLFRKGWLRGGGSSYRVVEEPSEEAVATTNTAFAAALGNEELRRRSAIRRAYLHAMKRARHTISILNAYFIPDRGLRRAMANAVKRGVEVKVMVPGRSDVPPAQHAGRYLFSSLLEAGVRIFEWPHMMHAKTAVVDRTWATIGSYNLDSVSMFHNLEVVLCVVDRPFGAALHDQLDADFARSRELTLAEWRRRPWWQKLVEWLWFRFRYWL